MKIGIMTFPNMTSYGCSMQMYGLYRAVELAGGSAEIINYQNNYMKSGGHTSSGKKKLKRLASKVLHSRTIRGFRNFENRMAKFPAAPVHEAERLPELAKRYGGVICGSDQVWNPYITDTDLSYFLNFCGPETNRIGYAPSFGISEFSEDFKKKIGPELKGFSSLSVREADGARMVAELTGREVATVLDPTFLIPRKEWEAVEKPHPLANGKYVLYFPVRPSAALLRYSRELAEKRGATLVVAESNYIRCLKNKDPKEKFALDITPEEWLNLFHHADCVVTNSFHGAAFAIHYHRDFYLDLSSRTNSRLNQLMEITGLQNRIIGDNAATWDAAIGWNDVEAKLAPEREKSLGYLRQAIGQ